MPDPTDKKNKRKAKPYDSYGTRKPTSTRRSKKRGRISKHRAASNLKAKRIAKQNMRRLAGDSTYSTRNKFRSEDNKKVNKPSF